VECGGLPPLFSREARLAPSQPPRLKKPQIILRCHSEEFAAANDEESLFV
jgi:hypothetical protein